jgi:hypothetical protein
MLTQLLFRWHDIGVRASVLGISSEIAWVFHLGEMHALRMDVLRGRK